METETLNWARIRRVCEIAENAGMYDVRAHEGYSEPGYDGVPVTGNWNDKKQYVEAERRFETIDATPSRVARILEKLGLELEWCDEWTECSECFKLVRTSGDSYEWTRSYVESEYGSVCLECVESDPEPYVEPMIGEAGQAWTLCTSMLTECGFEEYVGGFEHGLHPGQDSSPVEIAGRLAEHDVTDFVFVLDSVGQFDATFSVWVRTEDLSSLPEDPDELGKTDGPSVSAGLKAALQDVGRAEATVPAGPGPVMVKCDVSTGTATARRVSPEDFVKEAGQTARETRESVGRVPKLGQTMTVYNDNQVGVIVAVYALGTVDVEVTSGAGKGRRYRLTGLPFIARGADVCRA